MKNSRRNSAIYMPEILFCEGQAPLIFATDIDDPTAIRVLQPKGSKERFLEELSMALMYGTSSINKKGDTQ